MINQYPETGYGEKKHHEAIKYVNTHRKDIIKENLAISLQNKSINLFWKETNKIKIKV